MPISRRDFLATAALGSTSMAMGLAAGPQEGKHMTRPPAPASKRPALISKTTGLHSLDAAYDLLRRGGDTLDAVTLVCKAQEDDPNDQTVGLGGLPNEDGVVELDASCMHGPTRRAGAVGAVKNIKNVSLLARAVMDHTGHVMLVGEGAERFAEKMGFPKENLLTERSRKMWLLWKETMSHQDWWGPGLSDPNWKPPAPPTSEERRRKREQMEQVAAELGIEPEWREYAIERVLHREHGTIHCSAVNEKGEMSSMVSTCGLEWKIAGRVGDSPIIGAGCYTDQDVGSAGAVGNGEENIRVAGAHTIVENMRRGMSPLDAGMDAIQRVTHLYNNDKARLRYIQMTYFILRNDGAYAGVSLWSQSYTGKRMQFAVHDGKARLEDTFALFEGPYIEWPPVPKLPEGK
ncbi:MAG TPA: N(4)-(beta-N-acetylglucosaminyl)-L-asparaginase [Terriglobales bacterium]|nr:N(4)-(beta-N-acetylglucosaminyl)-L-asparaginase [Terriglobales bacterium]